MDLREKRVLTPKELQEYMGLGKTRIYQLCHTPGFPVFRINRKVLIDRERLEEWIAEQSAEQNRTTVRYQPETQSMRRAEA